MGAASLTPFAQFRAMGLEFQDPCDLVSQSLAIKRDGQVAFVDKGCSMLLETGPQLSEPGTELCCCE